MSSGLSEFDLFWEGMGESDLKSVLAEETLAKL